MTPQTYPFVPRSTAALTPGQFWSVALPDGRYACGRVLAPQAAAGGARLFLAALLDWVAATPPTAGAIAGRPVLAAGVLHVKSVAAGGGAVLGQRPLEADGIDPAAYGAEPPTWGFGVPLALAERHFAARAEQAAGGVAAG